MSNGNNFPQRKKNALNNYALNLSVPVPNEQGKFSNLSWDISRNNLTFKVYTGFSSDQSNKNGLIQARLDGSAFFGFMELIKTAVKKQEEWKGRIDYTDFTFFGGKRSDRPQHITSVYVGRDSDGAIWLSVVDAINKDRPRVKFFFGASRQYNFKHGDGSDYSNAETSQLFANAFYNMLSSVGASVMVSEYIEPKPRNNNGGQGGGYNNNNRQNNDNNSGGGSNNYEDDIPF